MHKWISPFQFGMIEIAVLGILVMKVLRYGAAVYLVSEHLKFVTLEQSILKVSNISLLKLVPLFVRPFIDIVRNFIQHFKILVGKFVPASLIGIHTRSKDKKIDKLV